MIKVKLMKNNNWLETAGYSLQDEERIYNEQLSDIYNNARWYLDNLDSLHEYRVSWQNYKIKVTQPYKFVRALPNRGKKKKVYK